MPAKGKKNLPIDQPTHRLIDIESAETGKPMYVLVREAFALYLKAKYGASVPGAETSPLPEVPSEIGTLIKGANVALSDPQVHNLKFPQEFISWALRLLYVLSGNYGPAVGPLKTSLEAFCVLTDLAAEVGEIERPGSPYPHPPERPDNHKSLRVEDVHRKLQAAASMRERALRAVESDGETPEESSGRQGKGKRIARRRG